jgi:hypothetical protein
MPAFNFFAIIFAKCRFMGNDGPAGLNTPRIPLPRSEAMLCLMMLRDCVAYWLQRCQLCRFYWVTSTLPKCSVPYCSRGCPFESFSADLVTMAAFSGDASALPGTIRAGNLTKQGHFIPNWKERMFVLSKDTLGYYAPDKAKPKSVLIIFARLPLAYVLQRRNSYFSDHKCQV